MDLLDRDVLILVSTASLGGDVIARADSARKTKID